MKTAWKVILIGAAMLALMSFGVRASDSECGEYIVSYEGGEYILFDYTDGEIHQIVSSNKFSRIVEYINVLNLYEAKISFAGVSVEENVVLDAGKYVFSGSISFTGGASLTVFGAELTLSNVSINFDSGSLRVKSGRVYVDNGEINADFCAVKLDYSSDADFHLKSGRICSEEDAAIKMDYGRCVISGGAVTSSQAVAILSKSTLMLSGSPMIEGREYGIFTESPITLSYEKTAFAGDVAVCYNSLFEEGEIKCVFYKAEQASLQKITLYDSLGQAASVRYFSEHERIDEKNFGAVYLPFVVNFYCNDEIVSTVEALAGEVINSSGAKEKNGYKFSSWSIDENTEIAYDFAQNVNNSFDLYAKYSLLPPSFVLNSLEFTYNSLEHEFGIEELSHPLLSEGVVNYTWYRDGEYFSNAGPKINLTCVKDSGRYECTLSFTYGADSVSVVTPPAEVKIHKQRVAVPIATDKYYTGRHQSPDLYSTSVYTVSDTGGTEVGIYPVKITLCDPYNYEFFDGSSVAFSEFSILKAQNRFIDELRMSDIYEGLTPNPLATACFGTVEYLYSSEYDGGYTAAIPTAPGVYYCIAYVSGCENYNELYSSPVLFSVIAERAVGISIENMPTRCEYTAFEKFDPEGLIVRVSYNSKREELIDGEKLSISYQSAESLRYGDSAVIASYKELPVAVSVSVVKAKYDMSQISFSDTSVIYDGTRRALAFGGALPTGLDGIPLEYSVLGGGVDAGVYPMTLSFSSKSPNYESPSAMTAILTVLPYESEVVFTDTQFVYDGLLKCPSAYYTDVHGRKVVTEVIGARSLAGEYTAEAICYDKNYKLLNFTASYNIAKADYDLTGVMWSSGDFVYDGEEKSVTLSGLPDGVSVIGYSDNKASSAGKYIARVTLSYDDKNYNPPEDIFCRWEIKRADYDLSLFSFSDSVLIYNGSEQYPNLSGSMPVGADGVPLEYAFSGGVTHVAEGRVAVEIIFTSASRNYNLPDKICAYVEILPLGISAVWQNTEFTYNGSSHAPTANAKESQLTVVGAGRDAGSYTATAISLNSDYYVINSSVDFIIDKTENRWLEPIELENIYEGRALAPKGEAMAGEVVFLYYSDAEGKCEIDAPTAPGKYYVRAYCEGDKNHKSIASETLGFEIIKVVPIRLHISMNRYEFFAFEVLDFSDFSITVENNDGSYFAPSGDAVSVEYATADSLRFGDTRISISCMGFCETIDISVGKADYDMSGVFWSESVFEYDGGEKGITLLGLPAGVRVVSYVGGVGKYAGEYPADAVLEYDTYNYNQPKVPEGVLRIRKRVIELPSIAPLIYNGVEQYPDIYNSELYSATSNPGISAGSYSVALKLTDSKNYEFQGGLSEATVYYEIEPRKITLRIMDIDKYLFEEIAAPVYVIDDGQVVVGEELFLSFVYTDDEIGCISNNPNYSVTVIPGAITRHNSLSEDGAFIAFLILLIILTLFFIFAVALCHKDRMRRYISVLKCRLSPVAREINGENLQTPAVDEPKNKDFSESCDTEAVPDISEVSDLQSEIEDGEEIALEAYNSVENALCVDRERADDLISDSLAKNLLAKGDVIIETEGTKKRIINVDTLSENFLPGDTVDVNVLKNMSLVPYDTAYIKVLARGMIDKPLKVYANDFSLSAIKMIALTGGEAIRVITVKKKNER